MTPTVPAPPATRPAAAPPGRLLAGPVVALAFMLLGVPLLAVVGVHQKFEGFPRVPSCTDGLATGQAAPPS